MEYLVAAYTDTGIKKETNQDSICVRRAAVTGIGETILAVVCDGMGGLKKVKWRAPPQSMLSVGGLILTCPISRCSAALISLRSVIIGED